jgi:competence protein ComFC
MKRWWLDFFPSHQICWCCSATPVRSFAFSAVWKQICSICQNQFTLIQGVICQICGRPMEEDGQLCIDCRDSLLPMVCNRSVVLYQGKAKEMIHLFKFRGKERLATPLGKWMAETSFHYYRNVPFSVISFVPLHPQRLHERGFNQAELLAKVIGNRLNLPVQGILERTRVTFSQSGLSRKDRLHAVQNAFQVKSTIDQEWLSRQKILLVDDVYTTGSTIRECVRPLLRANVKQVYAITFAR